ncbi:ubiquitin carboxyl-terminal hydrolase CYLD isoform X2 [Trichomycterus rosablanca]|uniref:ubiquitin carboxyl-terminal hydrolase CYLD isoform X2 n=1 Tax=Trichomycterus rosablanca TaxID=2290929 RepID=UPI002F35C557
MALHEKGEYYILTAKPEGNGWINPGSIGYRTENQYLHVKSQKDTVHVRFTEYVNSVNLPLDVLQPLTKQKAEFLLALGSKEDRLVEYARSKSLDQAVDLVEDSEVTVEYKGKWLKGVVRYIGRIPEFNVKVLNVPIAGVFFGVELQGEDRGKGENEGRYRSKTYFKCERNCGVFAPFNRVKSASPKPPASPPLHHADLPEKTTERLSAGDRVMYFVYDKVDAQHGMVLALLEENGEVIISTDRDEHGKEGGEITIPLQCCIKEENWKKNEPEMMDIHQSPEMTRKEVDNADITLHSLVEVKLATGPSYAIVRWIGRLPGKTEMMVGLELERKCGVSDGKFKDIRYFTCAPNCGLFVRLSACRLDTRFLGQTAVNGHFANDGQDTPPNQENVPPIRAEDVKKVLIGRRKGIQGHCNSCYMDSALFSLFSCSSVLDSLLFKKTNDELIQKTLLREIVCPLRSKGFVREKSVMKLRKQLQERGHSPSYTTDEKDPEEFLTLIMQDILMLEPLLKLQSCNQLKGGTQLDESGYFYQIFMDYNNSLALPTVQQLLEHSFYNCGIRLAEVPSCLILTMPRSGKQFKMFPKIIPSLELDITSLLSRHQQCVLCGHPALEECSQCFVDSVFSNTGLKFFCKVCSEQVHRHPSRQAHKPSALPLPKGFSGSRVHGGAKQTSPREKLELFAVLCIETSHYVSFVKYGPEKTDWIFFDSMADREGEVNGYNIPEVKACPEVAHYLEMPLAELAKQAPREIKGVAKRLFCDGYMYLYQSRSMALYH